MTAASTSEHALASDGGRPVRQAPLPGWPVFGDDDVAAAAAVLRSGRVNYWTGEQGREFEREFAAWAQVPHAVAVSNGTVALELALKALGVGAGDEVVVPSATFIATASAVAACGARPVVADVDPDSQGLTADSVAAAIGPRTVAVVGVHVGGFPADVGSLAALCASRKLDLVEDCAQAHGARRAGRPVGHLGRIAAWSFCQDKIMTTAGEGGAITTADAGLARRCWELKDHGKGFAAVHEREHPPGFRWLHESFGTNGRMTELQAAVGRRQLLRLDGYVARRRANAAALRAALADQPALRLPVVPDDVEPAYYRFYAQVRPERLRTGWDRDRVVAAITAEGVPCGPGGCTEIYREVAFDRAGRPPSPLPVARWLGSTSLVLPVQPTLEPADVADVARAAVKVLTEATA